MDEIWKDIEGYGGTFQVSNLGRIKTFNYKNTGCENILKPKKHNRGYLQIQLIKGNQNKTYMIHRLVAQAFVPNPSNLLYVNHRDEDKQNNAADNLEWCSSSYNTLYSMKLHPERKRKISVDRNINQCDLDGNVLRTWENARTIHVQTGMSDWSIAECCRGKRHTAYGYKWQYAN